ncbi:MAG: CorA family divalent cation transporter, partial [Candidatus Heimdallarchaeota archaeon]
MREKRGGISLKAVHNRILLKNNRILSHKAGFLSYVITDTFIDGYLDGLEEIEDKIEEMIILKAIRPHRIVLRELAIDGTPLISEIAQTYYTDVYDHILEANDTCSTLRDRLSSIVDIYLSSASNKMNDTMRLIAVLTAVITVPNLIASFGGINFVEFAD